MSSKAVGGWRNANRKCFTDLSTIYMCFSNVCTRDFVFDLFLHLLVLKSSEIFEAWKLKYLQLPSTNIQNVRNLLANLIRESKKKDLCAIRSSSWSWLILTWIQEKKFKTILIKNFYTSITAENFWDLFN